MVDVTKCPHPEIFPKNDEHCSCALCKRRKKFVWKMSKPGYIHRTAGKLKNIRDISDWRSNQRSIVRALTPQWAFLQNARNRPASSNKPVEEDQPVHSIVLFELSPKRKVGDLQRKKKRKAERHSAVSSDSLRYRDVCMLFALEKEKVQSTSADISEMELALQFEKVLS